MSNVTPLPLPRGAAQTGFDRLELNRILDLYGRMVAAGDTGRNEVTLAA